MLLHVRFINDIIIHSTATPAGRPVTVQDIRRWHTLPPPAGRGWKNIAYHYIILLDGTIERGRPISQPGTHCRGHNAHSIGVCYVGGTDGHGNPSDTRTAAQKSSMLQLITRLTSIYHCPVHGHRDYTPTDCPSFDVSAEYGGILAQILRKTLPKS